MGIFTKLFGSAESAAKKGELTAKEIEALWQQILKIYSSKREIILNLGKAANLKESIASLYPLIDSEIKDVSLEEKSESNLISDLEKIEHSHKIKNLHRIENCLAYPENHYEYVLHLMHKLHSCLKSQMHIVKKLRNSPKNPEKLVSHLAMQHEIEHEIIMKMQNAATFKAKSSIQLFAALATGEHILKEMDKREKKLLAKMEAGVNKILMQESNLASGITHEWIIDVYNKVQDIVEKGEAIIARGFDQHPYVDFEFVNHSQFVELAAESIKTLKKGKGKVSDQMINTFVRIYRDWYNNIV